MRKLTLALNALSAVLFLTFFAYTFVARTHLESIARNFVTEKTLQFSGPLIDTVEKALDAPFVVKRVSNDDLKLVRIEIDAYRKDAATYVSDLTGKQVTNLQGNPGPIARKAADTKDAIRRFYNDTLTALIIDLRIFSGTNVVAACVALFLVIKSTTFLRKPLVVFSLLIFVAVVFCSCLYIDDLSFFRILTSAHMGWWYPVFVIVIVVWLYKNVGDAIEAAT
jgi:hypothetical protein